MENENMKGQVIDSLFWKLLERGGVQGIQFILQLVLARLLTPDDYGIIAIIAIFITIANVFVQSGFNTALIQNKNTDEKDFSSVFYLSMLVALVLYIILFFISPIISKFYGILELTKVIRVLAITLFFGAYNSIQNAVVSKTMQFKKLFFSSSISVIISGVIGVILAYLGFGVWALVAQQLINQLTIIIILSFIVDWHPKLQFSIDRLKVLFRYGWKLLVSSLIDTFYMNIRSLIIGKIYHPSVLGFYNRGDQFPQIIVSNINGSIQSVMLPALSLEQDNKVRVKNMVRRAIVTSSFIIFPIMIGLAVIAEPLVRILLTDKWLPCVPFMQIFCISYALWPIHTANLQAINALGYSNVFLKLEIVKKIIGTIILVISLFYGVYAIAIGTLISGVISTFINSYPNIKILNYSYFEQIKDIVPSLLISIFMGTITYFLKFLWLGDILTLTIQILVGIFSYFMLAKLFKLECYIYLISILKDILKKRKSI
ncbi:lipopolysaccharide biosynthesis protein [Clostridium perfringens]|uniref:Lipopolysaccharide biosynthesis protein n=1 Tax=Clostridium perfringens TaxID=1502 RepID=A0AAP4EGD9_CLOPF|nr:lipopolysaccharide biosynthesis protein [Clostridium perfringens]MCI2779499.1 lipopolysaccharide biosynthesis protein [Clostridium perfringens]MDH2336741.1 lipopolysaccharide biosynthesis protein [Clostridium perfringens]